MVCSSHLIFGRSIRQQLILLYMPCIHRQSFGDFRISRSWACVRMFLRKLSGVPFSLQIVSNSFESLSSEHIWCALFVKQRFIYVPLETMLLKWVHCPTHVGLWYTLLPRNPSDALWRKPRNKKELFTSTCSLKRRFGCASLTFHEMIHYVKLTFKSSLRNHGSTAVSSL